MRRLGVFRDERLRHRQCLVPAPEGGKQVAGPTASSNVAALKRLTYPVGGLSGFLVQVESTA